MTDVSIALKPKSGDAIIYPDKDKNDTMLQVGDTHFQEAIKVGKYFLVLSRGDTELFNQELSEELLIGANYQILLQYSESENDDNLPTTQIIIHKITSENELHIFLLLPQFVIMTAGEIMFSITSLQFSFTQVNSTTRAREYHNTFGIS